MDLIDVTQSNSSDSEFVDAEDGEDYEIYSEKEAENAKHSNICDIRSELDVPTTKNINPNESAAGNISKSESFGSETIKDLPVSSDILPTVSNENKPEKKSSNIDYMQDSIWRKQKKHIFVLSEAGKPIYSLHGNEDKLSPLFGILQALVSFVQDGQDTITSIHAKGIKFVFLVRNSLILVAASRTKMSTQQLRMQLCDVYNQILSTLTYSQINKIFDKQKNFDLRRLLGGTERFMYHLLSNDSSIKKITNKVFTFLTNTVRVMPLPTSLRSSIVSAIQSNCSKMKNLVFAVLIADNKLITLVRMKKYSIHPADLRLIFNIVDCTEYFKTYECYIPICLPKFDMNGYLYAHISYLTHDCQACLLLMSINQNDFSTLSSVKQKITEKLEKTHMLEALKLEINKKPGERINLSGLGLHELRHFLYKPRGTAQLLCSNITPPYTRLKEFERLEGIYCELIQRIHHNSRPVKLIYEIHETEVLLAWITTGYELYAVFEPTVNKGMVIKYVDKLIKWIDKEEDIQFIKIHPNF